MKNRTLLFWIFIVWLGSGFGADSVKAELPLADGDRVLFLGDSITQDGRYVALVEAYLWTAYPHMHIDIVNAGLSSETVSGMTEPIHPYPRPNVNERLDRALQSVKPDWVIACYGMNDGIYHPAEPRITNAYRAGLTKLIETVAASGAKLILMTPPSFDVDAAPVQARLKEVKPDEPYGYKKPYEKYDETLVELAGIVTSLAEHEAVERVIDLHTATSKYLQRVKHSKPDYQYGDGIHPPVDGHLAIARGVLAGLGCDVAEANQTLMQLTGIAPPIGDSVEPTDQQTRFRELLFARFSKRSAAYRKAIGFVAPFKIDAPEVAEADQKAVEQERRLREMAAELSGGEALIAPYVESATKRWEGDIAKLETLNASESYPEDAILFIGSSSIRLWDNIAQDMSPYTPIRRGYGGARFSDLVVFAKRLITPHQYQALVVFVGNDVTGKPDDPTAEQVQRLAQYICRVSRAHQPDAPVFLIEVTPTESRFEHWTKICAVNAKLRELALTQPGIHFIATAEHYMDESKQPLKKYFREDRLHQNEAGYAVWSELIKQKLDAVLQKLGTK
jgi:lysophospholipase L1-like esterase